MATRGVGFFDAKGHYFRTPEEATMSDLAALLGRVGDGDGLALGISKNLLERRDEVLRIFEAHDQMLPSKAANVSPIRQAS